MFRHHKKHGRMATSVALAASVASMLLCCVMLVAVTYAWFSETVTNSTNTIKAGQLSFKLLQKGDGDAYSEVNNGSIFPTDKVWAPGDKVEVKLKVKNDGDLPISYELWLHYHDSKSGAELNAGSAYTGLLENVLTVQTATEAIVNDTESINTLTGNYSTETLLENASLCLAHGQLAAGIGNQYTESGEITLTIDMPQGTAYIYQNARIDFDIVVVATQCSGKSAAMAYSSTSLNELMNEKLSDAPDAAFKYDTAMLYVPSGGDADYSLGQVSNMPFQLIGAEMQTSSSEPATVTCLKLTLKGSDYDKLTFSMLDVDFLSEAAGNNDEHPTTVDDCMFTHGNAASVAVNCGEKYIVFTGCTFDVGTKLTGDHIILKNCYVGNTLITDGNKDNTALFGSGSSNIITIQNESITGNQAQ